MSLRLVLGRAGSGKTHLCLSEMRGELRRAPLGPPLIALVPEQASFQMEQALVRTGDPPGLMRGHVLSFRRLAWRVFNEVGGAALQPIGELGKHMMLRAILQRRKQDLRLFRQVAGQPGFIERLARTVAELKAHGCPPHRLRGTLTLLQQGEGGLQPLADKLHDLELVYREYEDAIRDTFTDPDDALAVAAERLVRSRLAKGAQVWVDGFAGFTPQEYGLLKSLLRVADRVTVALCVDPARWEELQARVEQGAPPAEGLLDEAELFHPTLESGLRLLRIAQDLQVPVDHLVLPKSGHALSGKAIPAKWALPRFAQAPALAHLERYLFPESAGSAHGGRAWAGVGRVPAFPEDPDPAVRLVEAASRRAEVEAAAAEIRRLRREEGYRYREIAVVVRDLEPYHDLIASSFRERGIPFFIDRKRPVAHHPLAELVRSALEVVLTHWAYEPVFRFLKTDLVPVERDRIDRLENYVLEHGLHGEAWTKAGDWRYVSRRDLEEDEEALRHRQAAQLQEINQIRREATEALLQFWARVSGGDQTVRSVSAALFELLEALHVPETLEAWAQPAEQEGDLEAAREHRQVWNGLVDLLDQLVEALGDHPIGVGEYREVLEAGLESLRLGLIPPGLDQVLVGSVERSRQPDVRATLVLGAVEGEFPPVPAEDVVFSDAERGVLAVRGLQLGLTARVRLFHEQYLTYIALTRPLHRLWVSYPLSDGGGRALQPSPVVRRLRELFPRMRVMLAVPASGTGGGDEAEPQAGEGLAQQEVYSAAQLVRRLGRALRRARAEGRLPEPVYLAAYEWARGQVALRAALEAAVQGAFYGYREERLPPELALRLFGGRDGDPAAIRTSISRLESFAACPFQHLAGAGLRLQERLRQELEPSHVGQLYHEVLSSLLRELQQEGLDLAALEQEELAGRVRDAVDRWAPRLQDQLLLSTPRYRHVVQMVKETLQTAALVLREHEVRGKFRPVALEVGFGGSRDQMPGLAVALDDGTVIEVRGRIDRVDEALDDQGRRWVRVIDYKSSSRKLDVLWVYYGLSLQLPVYLKAALQARAQDGEEAAPAGAFYFTVWRPVVNQGKPEAGDALEHAFFQQLRIGGLMVDNPAVAQMMDGQLGLGRRPLLPCRLKKDGSLMDGTSLLDETKMHQLLEHAGAMVRTLAQKALSGEVAPSPFRLGKAEACRHCRFRSVCRFDSAVEGYGYRRLQALPAEQVWTRLG